MLAPRTSARHPAPVHVHKGNKRPLTTYDTSFQIESLQTFHLALEGAYWEDYRRDEVAVATDRFEFKTGWPTVYALSIETALVKLRFADGTYGWGEANVPIGPEVFCLVLENLVLPMAQGCRAPPSRSGSISGHPGNWASGCRRRLSTCFRRTSAAQGLPAGCAG